MKKIILILSISLSLFSYGQETPDIRGQLLFGAFINNTSAGAKNGYCGTTDEIKAFEEQIVPIVSFEPCGADGLYEFYENGEKYFCHKYDMHLLEETITAIQNLSDTARDSLRTKTIEYSKYWHNLELKRANELYALSKKQGIVITNNKVSDESEYTNGTGYSIDFYNPSKKTIKYIWFTLNAYNPVKDFISSKTVKGVGPIKPDNLGAYKFDYVWTTDLVETVKLKSIKIQYMDGSVKLSTKPLDAFLSDRCAYLIFGDLTN